jgi:DNA modification methylase
MDLRNGNCLELMKTLADKSVDLFLCDLPYGETNCQWDTIIDMEEFWTQFKRIRKSKKTACIHFCSTKFGYTLIKSWEKGFKMDMVWKKRNKTGGLQSRHRPMRNHEMVYFFYDQAPKYNRDKYHKRIMRVPKFENDDTKVYGNNKKDNTQGTNSFDPPNPASVVEEKQEEQGRKMYKNTTLGNMYFKKAVGAVFDPPNPASVVEEQKPKRKTIKNKNRKGMGESHDIYPKENVTASSFTPPNPASVIEEESDIYGETKSQMKARGKGFGHVFDPPNPASVVEEKTEFGYDPSVVKDMGNLLGKSIGANFDPPNPVSVVEEEDEPVSMFESTKVFIGKRNHQTEKPQDILEFFLKYYTDEGDTVLDPTMGSGSTGVACKKMNRNFIGFELDKNIFDVAVGRCSE